MVNDLFELRPQIDDNRRDIHQLQRDFGSLGQQIAALNTGIEKNYMMLEDGFNSMQRRLQRYETRHQFLIYGAVAVSLVSIVIACVGAF